MDKRETELVGDIKGILQSYKKELISEETAAARIVGSAEIWLVEAVKSKPDQSRLLDEVAQLLYKQRWVEGRCSWKDSLLKELFRNYAKQVIAKTASIKDAEYNKLLEAFKEVKIHRASLMDEAKVKDEALIEWLLENCDCPRNDFPTEQPSRPRHKCWKCMQKLKATHTSGEAVKRNTAADPEPGME